MPSGRVCRVQRIDGVSKGEGFRRLHTLKPINAEYSLEGTLNKVHFVGRVAASDRSDHGEGSLNEGLGVRLARRDMLPELVKDFQRNRVGPGRLFSLEFDSIRDVRPGGRARQLQLRKSAQKTADRIFDETPQVLGGRLEPLGDARLVFTQPRRMLSKVRSQRAEQFPDGFLDVGTVTLRAHADPHVAARRWDISGVPFVATRW